MVKIAGVVAISDLRGRRLRRSAEMQSLRWRWTFGQGGRQGDGQRGRRGRGRGGWTRDCGILFRCNPRGHVALSSLGCLAWVLAQEMGSKSSIQVPGLENAPDAILDLDGQQHQKIGRFVKLHPLHQPGMLDDRWKLLAIGKTAECDLKSEAWAAIPLRCIPCNSSRWSE